MKPCQMIRRNSYRKTVRSVWRRTPCRLSRSCLRGRRRGPDDFAQMLTAYARLLRAHRRLARLAPRFFDAAVVARERENRAEQRRWLALWEPLLAKAYGVVPEPAVDPSKGRHCRRLPRSGRWTGSWRRCSCGWRRLTRPGNVTSGVSRTRCHR